MRLYVNVDHVATVRQARRTDEPDPQEMAALCEAGGADGITIHLREDRRHILDDDVRRLRQSVRGTMNLELATASDVLQVACDVVPDQATFVPERREEITTEGGLDLSGDVAELRQAIGRLNGIGVRVSLFIDPDTATIDESAELAVTAVELHTGEYANNYRDSEEPLGRLRRAARHAHQAGLAVHAGHGLTYRNVEQVAAIPEIEELNIGHSIVSRSIAVGMRAAVEEMRRLIDGVR
ncbi:MAG: pyridoxine 5'-phosphate synthase [Gemmatimonadales bacterium]